MEAIVLAAFMGGGRVGEWTLMVRLRLIEGWRSGVVVEALAPRRGGGVQRTWRADVGSPPHYYSPPRRPNGPVVGSQ